MTLNSLNPATGTLLRSFDALSAEAITSKIADAQQAFELYSETPLEHRVMWMKKLAGILEQEMEELATLLTMETGKTIRASREEVLQCAACCRYFAENESALFADETVETDANRYTTTWRPMGVLFAAVGGGNPFWQVFRFAVPALFGGNAMVLKHAANMPQCAVEMELLVRRAGFPRGVFQALLVENADVEIVLNDERITGLAAAGGRHEVRELAAQAAWMGKKAVLDGEDGQAFIVMPTANVYAAIQAGVASRCVDNGQSNVSAARFIVHEDVYDDFAMLFTAAMEDVKIGNPLKDETELGPLATEASVSRLKTQVAALVAAGGRVLTGGERMLGDGNYFEPTVIADVPRDASVSREELHGPVALLYRAESLGAAVAVVNAVHPGGVSVWTQDHGEQREFSRRLTCGSVHLNAAASIDARMPAGAMTSAGCGQATAAVALREFMTARTTVTVGVIPGEEFNFALTLDQFEQEAEIAEAKAEVVMDAPEKPVPYEAFDLEELEAEDDLLVLSQTVRMDEGALDARADKLEDQVAVAVMAEPETAAPVILAEKLAEIVTEKQVAAEAVVQATVPSFKDMFERALQVRA